VKIALLCIVLLVLSCSVKAADGLQVTVTASQVDSVTKITTIQTTLSNILHTRDPIPLVIEILWSDEYGTDRSASATATITVIQPIKPKKYKVVIPALFDFVAGSAKVDGQPVIPTLDGKEMSFTLDQTLLEGESVVITYNLHYNG
jgi:hypothetical protein